MLALSSLPWTGRWEMHRCLDSTGDLTASRARKTRSSVLTKGSTIFGIDVELNHGTLTCFRMVIDADGLDPYIASPRESIQDSLALEEVRKYLLAVFNRARIARPTLDTGDHLDLLDAIGRIADPPSALSQAPLHRMLRRAVDGNAQIISTLGFDDDDGGELLRYP